MMAKVKPHIEKQMGKSNTGKGNDSSSSGGNDVVKSTSEDSWAVKSEDLLKTFLSSQLKEVIGAIMKCAFDDIETLLWDILDPVFDAISSALVTLVGEIP